MTNSCPSGAFPRFMRHSQIVRPMWSLGMCTVVGAGWQNCARLTSSKPVTNTSSATRRLVSGVPGARDRHHVVRKTTAATGRVANNLPHGPAAAPASSDAIIEDRKDRA